MVGKDIDMLNWKILVLSVVIFIPFAFFVYGWSVAPCRNSHGFSTNVLTHVFCDRFTFSNPPSLLFRLKQAIALLAIPLIPYLLAVIIVNSLRMTKSYVN